MALRILVIPSAKRKAQIGLSITELLIASVLGVLVIIMAVSSLIALQRVTADKRDQVYLRQSLYDVLRYIGDDIRRAGFNAKEGETLRLTGHSSLFATSDHGISYVYNNEGQYTLTSLVGDMQEYKLKLCTSTMTSPPALGACSMYFSLLNEQRIRLTDFTVSLQPLGEMQESALISISLSATLVNSDYSESLMIKIKQRNWQ